LNIELDGKVVLEHEVTPLKPKNIRGIMPKVKEQSNIE